MSLKLAYAINGTAVGLLAEVALERGGSLVTYSSDYVFDGVTAHPYVESSPTHPLNVYGESKLLGEQLALEDQSRRPAHPDFVGHFGDAQEFRGNDAEDDLAGRDGKSRGGSVGMPHHG